MGVMPVIILLSLIVAGGFAIVYVVSARTGQFDDTLTPPIRMLFDDDPHTLQDGIESSSRIQQTVTHHQQSAQEDVSSYGHLASTRDR